MDRPSYRLALAPIFGCRRPPAAAAALCDANANERALQCGGGACLIDADIASGDALLRAAARLFGTGEVDFVGMLGGVRKNEHLLRRDFHKAARNDEAFFG